MEKKVMTGKGPTMNIISKTAMLACIMCITILLNGCISLKIVSVDQKTQLENQILGSLQAMEGDLVMVASVRGAGEQNDRISKAHKEALMAMLNRQFNADDLLEMKNAGVVGEKNDGLLAYFETERTRNDAEFSELSKRIFEEENRDREIIMKRIIAMNDKLTMKEYPQVKKMMYMLNVQNSLEGHKIQDESGKWTVKTATSAPAANEKK